MNHPFDSKSPPPDSKETLEIVGAGRLASRIWKHGDEQIGWRYRFNVFRTAPRAGRVSQLFAPADVVQFVKLLQVLAAVIADDGCLPAVDRDVLKHLAIELDALWERLQTSQPSFGCASCSNDKSSPQKGCDHGEPRS